ncbi:MAG: hypothetical protein ABIH23_27575 [bacterium]
MVEKITADAFRYGLQRLKEDSVLSPRLSQDLEGLAESLESVANWEEGESYLKKNQVESIVAGGPMSKVFRLLTCVMEGIGKHVTCLSGAGWCIDKMSLLDVNSGCSTYTGCVLVQAHNKVGETGTLIDGPFLWDCAAHDLPQEQAAQKLGYLCIVDFPEFRLPSKVNVGEKCL